MRLCLVAHLNDLSGANRSLIDLAAGLSSNNEVTVIVPRKGELYEELCRLRINVKVIHSATWVYKKDEKESKKTIKRIVNWLAEIRFFLYFYSEKFDLVHYNSYTYGTGAKAALKMKIPYTWHIRELPEENFNLVFFNKKKSVNIISHTKCIITISQFMKKTLSKTFCDEKIHVVYNGIMPVERYFDDEKEITLDEIVIIGAIAEDKGQLDAIRAIKLLHKKGIDKKLYIVGKITDEKYYCKICNEITDDIEDLVVFSGYHTDLLPFRKKNQLILMCSKAEAFGRVTIEAMNFGQIVIGADTGATPEIITDGYNGFLYKQGNYSDLANKILVAFDWQDKRTMSHNAKMSVADKYSISTTVANVEKIFTNVLGMKG